MSDRKSIVFDVRPGEAIGPFALGMTREELRALGSRSFGGEARAWDSVHPEREDFFPDLGIVVSYDASGRCCEVEVQYGYAFGDKCGVMLLGQRINWMRDDEVLQLCREHWPDVSSQGYWYDILSAGLRLAYYDTPSDGSFCMVSVFAPKGAA